MLLRFDSPPGIGKLKQLPAVTWTDSDSWFPSSPSPASAPLSSIQQETYHFSPSSIFFAQNCRTRNNNRGQGWTQNHIPQTDMRKTALWNSPNGTEAWYTLLVRGINGRKRGVTRRPSCTYCLIAYTKAPPVQPPCICRSSDPAVQLYDVTGYSGGSSFFRIKWKLCGDL